MTTHPQTAPLRLPGLVRHLLILALISGCAALRPARPPLSPSEVETVLHRLTTQNERVTTFYSMGSVSLRQWVVESEEADILVVGSRDPLRIKVEITHSWGAPVLHILVDRERFEAFSYPDKVFYTGPATPGVLNRFLPSPPDLDHMWALLRGYPDLPEPASVRSEEGPRVACGPDCPGGASWSLKLHADTLEPERLAFPDSRLQVAFDDIRTADGIRFAGVVRFLPQDRSGQVVIRNRRMVFNREIPDAVYTLKTPGPYREVELQEAE